MRLQKANTINYILKPFSQGVIHNSLLDNKQSQKSNGNEVLISTIIGQPTKLGMKALHKFIPVPNQFYLVLSVCRDPEDSLALLELLGQSAIYSEPVPKYAQSRFSLIEKSKIPGLIESLPKSVLLGISSPVMNPEAIESYYHDCIDAMNSEKTTVNLRFFIIKVRSETKNMLSHISLN